MSSNRVPGPIGRRVPQNAAASINDGTLARIVSPKPGPASTIIASTPSSDAPALPIPNSPIIIFIGGAMDSTTGVFRDVYDAFVVTGSSGKSAIGVKKYYEWTVEDDAVTCVIKHLKDFPHSPLVIAGHSYGGDTAMDVAGKLNEIGSGVCVQLAVTLDPVSRFDWEVVTGGVKTPNVDKWINVWVEGFSNLSDVIAVAGGHWGNMSEADLNIKVPAQQSSHAGTFGLFSRAKSDIETILASTIVRSPKEVEGIRLFNTK